jgi:hypothetical protein
MRSATDRKVLYSEQRAEPRGDINWARIESWTAHIINENLGPIGAVFSAHGAAAPAIVWNPDARVLKPPPLLALAVHWASLPREGRLPHLSRISPFDMRKALGYVLVLDVIDGGRDFRYRLFGSNVARISGFDMTGRLLSEHRASAYVVEFVMALYRATVWRGHPIYSARAPNRAEETASWQSLTLPFVDEGGGIVRVVTGTVALNRDGAMITA